VKERLAAWESSPVTTLMIAPRDIEQMRAIAGLVL
jgi:hypothetical protein